MAKSFSPTKRRNLADVAEEITHMEHKTAESLSLLDECAYAGQVLAVVKQVEKDSLLPQADRENLISTLKSSFFHLFNLDYCPEDYESLKAETKFLLGINQSSFILMAQRLKKIRDGKLYEQDGYNDFKSFIEKELPIAKTTVYCYIDVLTYFGVQSTELEKNLDYTKLFPLLPLLKSEEITIPKEEIRQEYLQKIQVEPLRQIKEEAKVLKEKYGLSKPVQPLPSLDNLIMSFKKQIPATLKAEDLDKLNLLVSFLKEKIHQH